MKCAFLISFCCCICLNAFCQKKYPTIKPGNNVFQIKKLKFVELSPKQIVDIKQNENSSIGRVDSNFIIYQDSSKSVETEFDEIADTVKIAYKTDNGNKWYSFATPFKDLPIVLNSKLIDFDGNGKPELVLDGETSSQIYPHGQVGDRTTIIYQLNTIPVQVFKFCHSCNLGDMGTMSSNYSDAFEFTSKQDIEIKDKTIIIGKLPIISYESDEPKAKRKRRKEGCIRTIAV
jgi:hypothetical protein